MNIFIKCKLLTVGLMWWHRQRQEDITEFMSACSKKKVTIGYLVMCVHMCMCGQRFVFRLTSTFQDYAHDINRVIRKAGLIIFM